MSWRRAVLGCGAALALLATASACSSAKNPIQVTVVGSGKVARQGWAGGSSGPVGPDGTAAVAMNEIYNNGTAPITLSRVEPVGIRGKLQVIGFYLEPMIAHPEPGQHTGSLGTFNSFPPVDSHAPTTSTSIAQGVPASIAPTGTGSRHDGMLLVIGFAYRGPGWGFLQDVRLTFTQGGHHREILAYVGAALCDRTAPGGCAPDWETIARTIPTGNPVR